MCESTCGTITSSAANQGDNTVSVAQGSTATPGATKQLLPPDNSMDAYAIKSKQITKFTKVKLSRPKFELAKSIPYDDNHDAHFCPSYNFPSGQFAFRIKN